MVPVPPRPPQRPPTPQPPPPEEPKEIIYDVFQKFEKDPRIDTAILKEQRQASAQLAQAPLLLSAVDAVSRFSLEFGLPSFLSSYKQTQEVSWALLCQGDLTDTKTETQAVPNLSIIYSNQGETYGRKMIDNQLFFEKVFPQQKVWSYDDFIDYHMNRAEDSERFSLIDSKILSTDTGFSSLLNQQITRLIFERPLSTEFEQDISLRRQNVMTKYPQFHFPHTSEGLRDLVFLIRSTQLIHSRIFHDLRERSAPAVLEALRSHTIFDARAVDQMARDYAEMIVKTL